MRRTSTWTLSHAVVDDATAARFKAIEQAYQDAKRGKPLAASPANPKPEAVRRIVDSLDARGAWIQTYAGESLVGQPKFELGFRYISSEVFARNVETLAEFVTSQN